MSDYFFTVERAGIHSTFQDLGYTQMQHLGITTGGVIDVNFFVLANSLVFNDLNETAIEFAYQGPRLKLECGRANIAVTGNVHFIIIKKLENSKEILGKPFRTYELNEGDIIDIIATKSSVYGYLSIEGGFKIDKYKNSGSTLVRSNIGPNNGEKIKKKQSIYYNFKNKIRNLYELSYLSINQDQYIRVLEGPQINFFSTENINSFFNNPFKISNNTDRMGIRFEGNNIYSLKTSNISSEGIIKGSIQIPGDGNPIALMADHPTIGGYPKIATIILIDISKLAQLSPGKEIYFKKISIETAENLYDENNNYIGKLIKSIKSI